MQLPVWSGYIRAVSECVIRETGEYKRHRLVLDIAVDNVFRGNLISGQG
jgi:hypothetical protein